MKNLTAKAKSIIIKAQYNLFLSLWSFVKMNFFEMELFVIVALVLGLYKRVPYVNLIISPVMYYVLLAFIAIRLFSLTLRQIMIFIMAIFSVMIFFAVSHNEAMTDMLANIVYFILCYLCLRMIIDIRKHL